MARSRVRLIFALQGAALGILFPFLVPLLSERGLGPADIGFVLGLGSLAALVSYPAWGVAADGRLGRTRTIALAGSVAAGGALLLLLPATDPLPLTMGVAMVMVGGSAWGPLTDAVALEALADDPTGYGRLRAWASLGWAVAAPLAGLTWAWAGPEPVLLAFAVLALALTGLVWTRAPLPGIRRRRVPRPSVAGPVAHAPPADAAEALVPPPTPARGLRGWRPLLASPVLFGFLCGLLVSGIGAHAAYSFSGLRILDQGGGTILVGIAASLPAIVEVPIFAGSRPLAQGLGLRLLFVFGALVASAILVLMAMASEAWMVAALRGLDGIAYAPRYIATVLIIDTLLPERMRAVGQSMAWLVAAGIAPVIGDSGGGLVYAALGGSALFLACAALHLAGGLIVLVVLRGPAFAPRRRPAAGPAAG